MRSCDIPHFHIYIKKQKCHKTEKNYLGEICDITLIQVRDIDRGRTNVKNVLTLYVRIEEFHFYKITNKNGTLK